VSTKEKAFPNREKLLLVIYEMSLQRKSTLKYEDFAVKAFKKYPEFQLRGYPEYPDTEHISKRLYDLRKEGLIKLHNKFITLTEKGKTHAKQLIKAQSGISRKLSQKLSRDILSEINRIKNTDAFQLFSTDKKDQIVDTDFFAYLGTTVKTERTDFRARIKTIQDVIDSIKGKDEYKIINELHNHLFERFKHIIKEKLSIGYPRRKHE
jgi:hypothetical protein